MESSRRSLRVALAQINPTAGDLAANTELVAHWISHARDEEAAVVVFPELALTGWAPAGSVRDGTFLESSARYLEQLASGVDGIVALLGAPTIERGRLHDALCVLADGRVAACSGLAAVPDPGAFDGRPAFEPGPGPGVIELDGIRIALTVGEDVRTLLPPAAGGLEAGVALIVNATASPYRRGAGLERERAIAERARSAGVPIASCNGVGGHGGLVFDGHSFVVDGEGGTLARAGQFDPELLLCDIELSLPIGAAGAPAVEERSSPAGEPVLFRGELTPLARGPHEGPAAVPHRIAPALGDVEGVYAALRLRLADHVRKNRFGGVVLALSGDVDSALVALLAADVIDPPDVHCVVTHSQNLSEEGQVDARAIALNVGASLTELPTAELIADLESILSPHVPLVGSAGPKTGAEALETSIRDNLVTALAPMCGWLPLATHSRSEGPAGSAVARAGGSAGFAAIGDVPGTLVGALVRYRNELAGRELVPASVLERAPA